MEVLGKIKVIESIIEKGTFKSRNVIVTTDEQYPQQIAVQFVQDKCDILDKYKEGENIKVSINLRGREWVDPQGVSKYFNTIQGWRIEKLDTSKQSPNIIDSSKEPEIEDENTDPLPF